MTLPGQAHLEKDGFRLRGLEVTRIDAFSDVVFGFALTLLVVSLEIPKTFTQLHNSLGAFLPFAICFYFLMLVWYSHYRFFRRYGLTDTATIVINAALLFVILFFVYPLKFLFTMATLSLMGGNQRFFENHGQLVELMVLYGVGFAQVYLLVAALYWNAWRQRVRLELTPLEIALTVKSIVEMAGMGAIGLLSCVVAELLPPSEAGWAGLTFILIRVFHQTYRRATKGRIDRIRALQDAAAMVESPESV